MIETIDFGAKSIQNFLISFVEDRFLNFPNKRYVEILPVGTERSGIV